MTIDSKLWWCCVYLRMWQCHPYGRKLGHVENKSVKFFLSNKVLELQKLLLWPAI